MWALKTAVMTLGLGICTPCWAQDGAILAHDALDRVGAGSIAPQPYGWKLDTNATSTSVDVGGVEKPLLLSDLFPNGVALGTTAAEWTYRPNGEARDDGPQLHVYPAGMLAIEGKHPAPGNVNDVRVTPLDALAGAPDLFVPRLGDAAPLAGAGACPDLDGARGVYFYATELEPAGDRPAQAKMIITWYRVLPAGDCDAEPNTFQMVVTAQPLPAGAGNVRPPARVEFRYGDCGWSVPDQAQVSADLEPAVLNALKGARSGLLFDSSAVVGGEARRAIEVLGAREQNFSVAAPGTPDEGALNAARPQGASGNPLRFKDHCNATNVAGDGHHGQFVFELDTSGLMFKDGDGDGVPDGDGGHDNCPEVANPYQGDADSDLRGDACDQNADADEWGNFEEFCDLTPPTAWNIELAHDEDVDMDGLGDACDLDLDGDGVRNLVDNCPRDFNPRQLNIRDDSDGLVCDQDEEAVINALIEMIVRVLNSGWTPQRIVTLIDEIPGRGAGFAGSKLSFVEWWMAETGKPKAEIWTRIHALFAFALSTADAQTLRAVVGDTATGSEDDLWLLYDWSKTGLDLGDFLDKHGKALLEEG